MVSILLNGRKVSTAARTVTELQAQTHPDADVTIYNGFQTAEDFPLCEGDTVAFLRKGVMPNPAELESLLCARHTPKVHQKVKAGAVAVAGLGGLGSQVAVFLARTGVGRLLLVDFDVVEPSNLNRQHYDMRHLGRYKTEALQEQLLQINPYLTVEIQTLRVTPGNAVSLFSGFPIVCEAFDNPAAKADLINTLLEQCPGVRIVAASGMAGYGSANDIHTKRKFQSLYVCGDGHTEAQPGCGLMAPRVAACAAHQANMILRLLLGIETE